MHIRRKLLRHVGAAPALLGAPWLFAFGNSHAQQNSAAVGNLERAEGAISRIHAGGTQELRLGQPVYEGDRIATGVASEAVIKLIDGAVLAVRPASEINLAQYRFTAQKPQDSIVILQLIRGGLRKVTGFIGKANASAVRITTPTATIGVRGTEFEVTHVEPPPATPGPASGVAGAAADNSAAVAGNPAASAPGANSSAGGVEALAAGTYTRVFSGTTTLRSNEDGKQIDVPAGQSAFAPDLRAALAVGGAVVQSFGLLRNSPARVFFDGKFDGSLESLSNTLTNELQQRINQRLPSELRNVLPNLGNLFKR